MAIPDFQSLLLPLLQVMGDGKERMRSEFVAELAMKFALSEEEKRQTLVNKTTTVFAYRVGWARTYLVKAKLLDSTRYRHVQISSRGVEILRQAPQKIDINFLRQFPEFKEFYKGNQKSSEDTYIVEPNNATNEQAPEELIQEAYQRLRNALANELLETLKQCSPQFFERLVVDLLVKMGYGGTRQEAGKAIGRSGDEGIDGIINEDRLGLDVVYIQAKRWEGSVGRPEIQKFVGALAGQSARKGVFITTSEFLPSAKEYAQKAKDYKIILIDGQMLGELMIDYNVGVTVQERYEIKRIDSDYFSEE